MTASTGDSHKSFSPLKEVLFENTLSRPLADREPAGHTMILEKLPGFGLVQATANMLECFQIPQNQKAALDLCFIVFS
jgi:hypothetical protein